MLSEVTGEFWALGDGPRSEEADSYLNPRERFPRPVPIGVSAGQPDVTAGTIGARVSDGSEIYALSNNHVFANRNDASKATTFSSRAGWTVEPTRRTRSARCTTSSRCASARR